MTLEEFFRKARQGRTWHVEEDGAVRCANGNCPLAAVSGRWLPTHGAKDLKMRLATVQKIVRAADHARSPDRLWLLKRLGIAP